MFFWNKQKTIFGEKEAEGAALVHVYIALFDDTFLHLEFIVFFGVIRITVDKELLDSVVNPIAVLGEEILYSCPNGDVSCIVDRYSALQTEADIQLDPLCDIDIHWLCQYVLVCFSERRK